MTEIAPIALTIGEPGGMGEPGGAAVVLVLRKRFLYGDERGGFGRDASSRGASHSGGVPTRFLKRPPKAIMTKMPTGSLMRS